MTTQKDFKRLVRARMHKTGESYTAARAQILHTHSTGTPVRPDPSDYARIAGYSDDAVKAKTGCTWERWVRALDRHHAHELPHRDIAKLVHEEYLVKPWWAQMVTVGYERIKGLRQKGQRRGGGFEISKSKTVGVPLSRLYRAFSFKRTREKWLDNGDLAIRTASKEKSMRISWGDGTSLHIYFAAKGPSKSQVTVQHVNQPTKAAAERMRGYWGERLSTLRELLQAG